MAEAVQVAKLCKVYVDAVLLGYTRNGAELEQMLHQIPVYSDENGGDQGPPCDIQALPSLYRIHLSLTKFDKTVFEAVEATIKSATNGTFAVSDVGIPYVGGSKYFRVTLQTTTASWIRNFPICIPQSAIAYNLGTRHSEATIDFLAMRNMSSGLVWDQTSAV